MPFTSSSPERCYRVAGWRGTFQNFIDILGDVQGVEYKCIYLSPDIAAQKQLEAVVTGDVAAELEWAAKPIGATGVGDVEPVDKGLFDFEPEDLRKTFGRMFRKRVEV